MAKIKVNVTYPFLMNGEVQEGNEAIEIVCDNMHPTVVFEKLLEAYKALTHHHVVKLTNQAIHDPDRFLGSGNKKDDSE